MSSNKTDVESNPFERTEEGNIANRWQNYARNSAFITRKQHHTHLSKTGWRNGQTGRFANEFEPSSLGPASPKNSGQNSLERSPISRIEVQRVPSTTGHPTKRFTAGDPTFLTSLPLAQRLSFISLNRRPKSWILTISKELWSATVEAINIEFGSQGPTRFESPGMFDLSEKW